jgi:hypothetical protein
MKYLLQFVATISVSAVIAVLVGTAVLNNVNAQLQQFAQALEIKR